MSASAVSATARAIRVLPADVAARIAAGEVVERPVSVVRELLDNAIDAGATRITVETEDGGIALIRVTDDGRGIPPEDVELAFERHATSKIAGLADLARVHTLGFRGEALPSIAAAADVELTTRVAAEPVGVHVALVDARVVRRAARPSPPGTAFAVRDLFARVPARRKFLASPAAESRQVSVVVAQYALAYPGIAFRLVSNGRVNLQTPGDGDLRHAFAAIHGAQAASEMLVVEHNEDDVCVRGLAGPPSLHRGTRAALSIFVNGRWVQSRSLTFAAADAYQSLLPGGRHPMASLAIGIPDDDVDVNVHPAKAEVRFRDERGVARAVRHAVSRALDGAGPVPFSMPAGREVGGGPRPTGVAPGWTTPTPLPLRERLEPPAALRGPEPTQPRLDLTRGQPIDAAPAPSQREVLPLLRVVGQVALTYVVTEGPDGMYLIDQHAAHERVVYDRIVGAPGRAAASQPLLEPVLVELDPTQLAIAEEYAAHLDSIGLRLEAFGPGAYQLRAIPAGLGDRDLPEAVRSLLEALAAERRVSDAFGRAAATVACHASVRAGTALAMEEMRRLVEDLELTTSPRTCPHGRPTLLHVGAETIERQFGRR